MEEEEALDFRDGDAALATLASRRRLFFSFLSTELRTWWPSELPPAMTMAAVMSGWELGPWARDAPRRQRREDLPSLVEDEKTAEAPEDQKGRSQTDPDRVCGSLGPRDHPKTKRRGVDDDRVHRAPGGIVSESGRGSAWLERVEDAGRVARVRVNG